MKCIFPLSPTERSEIQEQQVRVAIALGHDPDRVGWSPEQIAFAAQGIQEEQDELFLAKVLAEYGK